MKFVAFKFVAFALGIYLLAQMGLDVAQFYIETHYTMTHCNIQTNEQWKESQKP